MTNTKKVLVALLVLLCASSMIFAQAAKEEEAKPIVVIYTNDIHCGYVNNCGYTGLAALKAEYEAEYGADNVTLVDCGDAIQGAAIGTVSKGSYIVKIMNEVGYDFGIFGNHEFDYDLTNLFERIHQSKMQYLNSNIIYKGVWGQNKLAATKPYAIVDYNGTKVAYIGVSTPESIIKSTPRYFTNSKGEYIYDFLAGKDLYACVQNYVDEVRAKGADYVVVLAHLGLEEDSAPNRGTDLIANITGVDVILDGHSHSIVESDFVKDKAGKDVLYTQTGINFQNIGVLTIDVDGTMSTKLVKTTAHDENMDALIAKIDGEYKAALQKVVAKSEVDLKCKNEDGARAVRNRETAIGDFCADAYKTVSGADVAFVNGGGIRADLNAGDITPEKMIAVHPYGNMLCMCEATGQEIIDALEHGSKNTQKVSNDGPNAVGESGGFLQVAGLKYTIDTSVPSHVVTDEKGMFIRVDGARRVKNVMVGSEEKGWQPIDLNKTYTLACHDYKLHDMGDGFTMFADNKFIIDRAMIDNQVIITYITDFLGGNIPAAKYSQPKGRITVI